MDENDPIPALKQQLRDALIAHIGHWNQFVAAKAIETDQPRMSDLERNRLDRFSLETLVRFLTRVELRVEIKIVRLRQPRMFRFPTSASEKKSVKENASARED